MIVSNPVKLGFQARRLTPLLLGFFAAIAVAMIGPLAHAAQLTAGPSNFAKVLGAAHPGDNIALAPGAYPNLIVKGVSFAHPVTITSSNPKTPAVISEMTILGAEGLLFRNVEIVAPSKGWAVIAMKSSRIGFDHVFVHGSLDDDASNDGGGLSFLNTSDVTVTYSEFAQLRQGVSDGASRLVVDGQITVGTPTKALIQGNYIHDVMKSGMVFAGVSDVTITGNTIRNIRIVPPQHPDAIQFFTTGTLVAAHDIVVSDNLIDRGKGEATQGIFFRDQVGTIHYEHVKVSDNLVVGTGYGGIYMEGVNDAEITGNELTSEPGRTNLTFFLIQHADKVRAINNRAVAISFDKVTGLTEAGDKVTQPTDDHGAAVLVAWRLRHPPEKEPRPGIESLGGRE
jgi:hypothetical protein